MHRPLHNLLIAFTIASITIASLCSSANAQSMSHPDSKSPLKPNPYLKYQDPWRWDIRSQVFLRAGTINYINGRVREQITGSWDISDFEFIFPVVRQGGHYWSPNEDVKTTLRIDDAEFVPDHEILLTPNSKAPFVWWKSNHRDSNTHQLHITQISHIVCADTVFDEKRAKEIPWPTDWPLEAERFLSPVIDQIELPIDIQGQDRLAQLVDGWLEGNDPKSIDEVTLVKFLTGKVIEFVRVTKSSVIYSPTVHARTRDQVLNAFSAFPKSSWSGFIARSADQIVLDPSGSPLDLSTMLTAVLRVAGVPARLVLCYENDELVNSDDRIRSLVEFAMYDKERDQILWIPIDPEELRDNGRRSNVYKQIWQYFGTHDQLHNYVPLSYYFHPPVNYKAYGYPGLYGLKTSPDIGRTVSQVISIDVVNSQLRGDELKAKKTP